MLSKVDAPAEQQARTWVAAFNQSLIGGDKVALAALFATDCHWRNLCGLSWNIFTQSGRDTICDTLLRDASEAKARDFGIAGDLLTPRRATVAGQDVIEAIFRFVSANGAGLGVVRLLPGDHPQAWTISTLLDMDGICAARRRDNEPVSHARDFAEASWLDQRAQHLAYEDREPDVLIVGGGHAGISAAVELKRLGFDALIVDKEERVGDNWRLRYNGLKLHNKTPVNHLRYMPFPVTWPDYIPKDKIANWLETYVESMDLDFWTRTTFEGATYDDATATWQATVRRDGHAPRTLHPKHIVLATSVSSVPNIPAIPTIENFKGTVLHSSQFTKGADWRGKSALVLGTGTSSHDIAQELQANGVNITMVQRSPTMVINVDPSAQLYDKTYLDDGPPIEVRDTLNSSVPLAVMKIAHKIITDEVRKLDAPLLQRLEKAGFRLEFGEGGTGWPLKFRQRGGGYYFNVGCSELIADGKIGLVQAADIKQFIAGGVEMTDGTVRNADLVVLATGYKGQGHMVGALFGDDVAERVGRIWGFEETTQELRNMWVRTKQPGLWFTGGAFSQCRIYSRYMALQIEAIEAGRLIKAAS
ncbi:MAG: NAD(P)-binding domain-containing protein [Rhizobiales bacterium]|nr:NAD(P)-binding domain-containing protein [Hyphomicrobiales bacterium]